MPPVPPSFDVIGSVVLTWSPEAVASTSTETVQLVLARIVAPAILRLVPRVVTRLVSQLPLTLSGLAISRPAGMLSLKLTPVRSVAGFGLVMVKVSVTLSFNPTVGAENDLTIVGGDCASIDPAQMNIKRQSMVKNLVALINDMIA